MVKDVAYYVHEAKTYRLQAGRRVKAIENAIALAGGDLSRSTISRIESGDGVSEASAYAYFHALRAIAPAYPHPHPFTYPENSSRPREVRIDQSRLQ